MNIASNLEETAHCRIMKAPVWLAATQYDIIPDTSLVTTFSTHTHIREIRHFRDTAPHWGQRRYKAKF